MLRTLFWSEAPTTSPGPVRPRRLGSQSSHGQKIAQRGGGKNAKKRAVVAVARKLSVVLHHLWISVEVYEPLHNARCSGAQGEEVA
jgi:hypothetical protein